MAWPSLVVELGLETSSTALVLDDPVDGLLGTGTLGRVAFFDATSSVLESSGVQLNRGSTRNQGPYFRYEAGSCQFTLDNRDGDWDPTNLSGPHVAAGRTKLQPGVPVRISATYQGQTFRLFAGAVQSWQVEYGDAGLMSTATVTAVDPIATLSAADPLESPEQGSGENVGRRIARVLSNVGWPLDARDLDTSGLETLLPTTMATAAWSEATLAADSVNGYLAADRTGTVVYLGKASVPRVSSLVFDDQGTGLPFVDVETSYDDEQTYNVVKLARDGGTEQARTDSTSQARYGLRGYSRSDLVVSTDQLVADSADYIVGQFSDLETRIEGLTSVLTSSDPDSSWRQMLGIDVLQRATVSFETPDGRTVSRAGLVRGVGLSVRTNQWRWSVSFTQAPDPGGDFILGSETFGVLGQNTLQAF